MTDIEACILHAKPRKVWTVMFDGKQVWFFLWPWLREPKRRLKPQYVPEEVWKPPV